MPEQNRAGDLSRFAAWLDGQMRQRRLGNNQLAQRLGVSSSAISEYRRGLRMPRPDKQQALASFFGAELEHVERLLGIVLPAAVAAGPSPTTIDVHDPELAVMLADVGDELTDDELAGVKEYLAFVLARKRAREQAAAGRPV